MAFVDPVKGKDLNPQAEDKENCLFEDEGITLEHISLYIVLINHK